MPAAQSRYLRAGAVGLLGPGPRHTPIRRSACRRHIPEDAPASWPGYADDPRSCRFTDGRLERSVPASQDPFSFGGQLAGGTPYSRVNLRLLDPTSFELGGAHFIVTATWQQDGRGDPLPLAALSTLHAALHTESAI